MADENKDTGGKNRNIHTSYVGTFDADSFAVDDKGVASATLKTAGGDDKVVKGYNDNAKTLEDAVKAGGEQIVRGTMLGGGKNPHMGIYATGPEQIAGVAKKIRHNFDTYEAEGKQPYVNAFVGVERGENGDTKIHRPVTAFGDDALSLKGIEEGDRLSVPARVTHEQRDGKDGKQWQEIYRVTGEGSFEKAPAKDKEEEETPNP